MEKQLYNGKVSWPDHSAAADYFTIFILRFYYARTNVRGVAVAVAAAPLRLTPCRTPLEPPRAAPRPSRHHRRPAKCGWRDSVPPPPPQLPGSAYRCRRGRFRCFSFSPLPPPNHSRRMWDSCGSPALLTTREPSSTRSSRAGCAVLIDLRGPTRL